MVDRCLAMAPGRRAHHRGAPRVAVRPVPGGWAGVGEAVTEVFVEEELHTRELFPHYASEYSSSRPCHQGFETAPTIVLRCCHLFFLAKTGPAEAEERVELLVVHAPEPSALGHEMFPVVV